MEFHQSSAERFAERLFNHLSKHFDGKIMNSEEFNVDLMIKSIPYEIDEDVSIDISPKIENPVNNSIKLVSTNNDEPEPELVTEGDNVPNSSNEFEPTPIIDDDEENNTTEEIFKDDISDEPIKEPKKGKVKKEKVKKVKKVKKEKDPNKPKRLPNSYINWKGHPDNAEAINTKAEEINEETGKKYGKRTAASYLWNLISKEEQQKWKSV